MVGGPSGIGAEWRWLIRQLQMAGLHINTEYLSFYLNDHHFHHHRLLHMVSISGSKNNTTCPNGYSEGITRLSAPVVSYDFFLSLMWAPIIQKFSPSCGHLITCQNFPLANARGWLKPPNWIVPGIQGKFYKPPSQFGWSLANHKVAITRL